MSSESTIMVESHRSAATLYASGELTADSVLRAIAQVEQLPNHVRALCVDLRAVRVTDERALRALDIALRDWRAGRRGMSRVRLPEHAGAGPVSLGFPHTRRSSLPLPVARVRNQMTSPFRDRREVVVTRSLRERAGSETR